MVEVKSHNIEAIERRGGKKRKKFIFLIRIFSLIFVCIREMIVLSFICNNFFSSLHIDVFLK